MWGCGEGYVWICMDMHGYAWAKHRNHGISNNVSEVFGMFPLTFMEISGKEM